MGTPGLGTPGLGTPGFGTPGLGTPGLGTPGLGTPGTKYQYLVWLCCMQSLQRSWSRTRSPPFQLGLLSTTLYLERDLAS